MGRRCPSTLNGSRNLGAAQPSPQTSPPGYTKKGLFKKKKIKKQCILLSQTRKRGHHQTRERSGDSAGQACRAGGGDGGRRGSAKGSRRSGLRALRGEGSFLFGGAAYFLTAYFFICFIQFLQRVQKFLWGENVCGSWGGRKDL